MSQHYFETDLNGKPVTVKAGYDRPLRGFFMLVYPGKIKDERDEFIYCNLDDPILITQTFYGQPSSFDYFLGILEKIGLAIPPQMIQEIIEDGQNDVGNKWVEHRLTGNAYERLLIS